MTARTPPAPWHPESPLPPARDRSDRPLLWSALALAGLLHLGALCLPLPPAPAVELPDVPRGPTITLTGLEIVCCRHPDLQWVVDYVWARHQWPAARPPEEEVPGAAVAVHRR